MTHQEKDYWTQNINESCNDIAPDYFFLIKSVVN